MGSATQTRYGAAESSGRTDILSPLEQHSRASESFVFFLLVSASQRPISRLLFAAGSWRGVSSSFHRRHRPSSSSSIVRRPSSSVVRRRPSSSSSIVVVITHHRHHTLLPSHSPLYSHVIAILILVLSSPSHHHPRLIFVRHCVIAANPTYHHCLFS